jgi:hypothetical protein
MFFALVNCYAVYDIDIDIFINCNWVDTRWQYTFTHKQHIEHQNYQQNNTNNKQNSTNNNRYVGRSLPMFCDKLSALSPKGPKDCLTTSVNKKQLTLCKIAEEQRPHLHRGISLKCHISYVHRRANRSGALVPFFLTQTYLHKLSYLSKTNTEFCLLYQVPKMKIQPCKYKTSQQQLCASHSHISTVIVL